MAQFRKRSDKNIEDDGASQLQLVIRAHFRVVYNIDQDMSGLNIITEFQKQDVGGETGAG